MATGGAQQDLAAILREANFYHSQVELNLNLRFASSVITDRLLSSSALKTKPDWPQLTSTSLYPHNPGQHL